MRYDTEPTDGAVVVSSPFDLTIKKRKLLQANEAFAEMQSKLGHVIEQQIQEVSEQLQTGLEESSKIADEGLQEGKRMTKAAADEAQRSEGPGRKR